MAAQLCHEQAKRVQRLAQVMTCRREEAGFREVGERQLMGPFLDLAFKVSIRVLQLFCHLVELVSERFKLVAGPYRNALSEIAAADASGAPAQRLDRNYHAARKEQPGQEGQRKAGEQQHAGAHQRPLEWRIGLVDRQL